MLTKIKSFIANESGATAIEYALIAQESPHFVNGHASRLFGPHKGRTEGLKVPH